MDRAGQSFLGEVHEATKDQGSDGESNEAAGKCESDALGDQLASETTTGRAQGETRLHLLLALGGAREHEVGDVGAGDEKDEADSSHENHERGLDVADGFFEERMENDSEIEFVVGVGGVLLDHGAGDTVHVGLNLGERETGLDAPEDFETVTAAAVLAEVVGSECQRSPDFGFARDIRIHRA